MPKISVIIPVYNLQDYIERAITSVTSQSFKDVEIIVVNDGSTDNTSQIVDELAEKDDRIKHIIKENEGPGAARNMGFESSNGEWVWFLDGDDYMLSDAIEKMYSAANDCDMVVCNTQREYSTHKEGPLFKLPTYDNVNDVDRISKYFLGKITMGEFTDNKMYNRKFLESTGVKFENREDIFAEDSYFFAKVLKTMDKIAIVDEVLVVYFQRDDSATNSFKENLAERCERFMVGISEWYDHAYDFELKTRAFRFFYDIIYNDVNAGFKTFKKTLSNKYFLDAIDGMNQSTLTLKQKLIIKLLHNPAILYSIIRKRGLNEGKEKGELPEDIITIQAREFAENINLLDRKNMIKNIANTLFIKSLRKNFKKIISFTLTIFVLMLVANTLFLSKEQTMILRCNYPEAAKGLYPDGTWFDIFAIKSETVLNDVIENHNITDMTTGELRDRVAVFAINDEDIISRTVAANTEGKDFYYITNEYTVTYNQKNKFAKNEAYDMLQYISEAYSDNFFANYTEKNTVLNFEVGDIELDKLEYVEIGEWFTKEIESMQQFITARANENGSYRATSTDQTFINIQKMLQNFKNTTLEKYIGFVSQSGLAKNKEEYIHKLNYKIDLLERGKSKQQAAHDFRIKAIQEYDSYITGVAFIPSIDKDNNFYMNRTMTGIDYLTNDAYDAGLLTEKYEKRIQENNTIKKNIESKNLTEEEYSRTKKTADEMIVDMCNQLKTISKIAVDTDNEYIKFKTFEYLEFVIPEKNILTLLSPVTALAVAIMAGIVATIVVWIEAIISAQIAMLKRKENGESNE